MIFLSYYLSLNTPLYGNSNGIKFILDKQIRKNDSCNTMNISFPNHSGTHIDFPVHFDPEGKSLNDYTPEFWEFNHVEIVDLSGKITDSQIIGHEYFKLENNVNTEMLLIKTGYGDFRGTDRYTLTPPGLSSGLAPFFRNKFPKLRCIGVDLISISSYANREEGRRAHHAFLNPKEGDPILLIEDMKLDNISQLKMVIVAPLLIDNADGSPCTVLAYEIP